MSATFQPWRANSTAVARPTPALPPVMTTTFGMELPPFRAMEEQRGADERSCRAKVASASRFSWECDAAAANDCRRLNVDVADPATKGTAMSQTVGDFFWQRMHEWGV